MVSEAYKRIEDNVGQALILQDDLVGELMHKLGKDKMSIERAVYLTCVTCAIRPLEVVHVVNEFMVHLKEGEMPKQEEEQDERT